MTCGATSIYQEGESTWTYTCQEDESHDPGEHVYTLDEGQEPPALPTESSS